MAQQSMAWRSMAQHGKVVFRFFFVAGFSFVDHLLT